MPYPFYIFLHSIMWLFDGSDIIFPSVYLREKLSPSEREQLIRGRVREAVRVAQRTKPRRKVLTYLRYVYTDSIQYLTEVSMMVGE